MIISNKAIDNRISVMVLIVIIFFIGVSSYFSMPRENEPDVTIPYVFVSTTYSGVSSSDIETTVTMPIEKKLKGLEGVKKISSVSSEGVSSITIEFETNVDIDDAIQKVRNKVDEAKNELPQDLEDDPYVFEINLSETPIIIYAINGLDDRYKLKQIADDLKDEIEAIDGVLEVELTGGIEREIIIEVDAGKLAYYNIPITDIQQAVTGENKNTTAGTISLGDNRYQLQVPGEIKTPEEADHIVVGSFNGNLVYLKNVAKIVDGFEDETTRSRLDGEMSVNIAVKKRIGKNIIEIIDKVDNLLDTKKKNFPAGLKINKLMDKSKDINNMIADLENNILTGLVLVIVVLFFALGFRNSFLVALSIPFSMFISFAVMQFMGITLNMVVLFSLTLALGMLVDNAIVIVENIYRFIESGYSRITAAKLATSEVAYPIIGSTLTTIAAFFPMIFWPGIMGDFMKFLPITLVITLLSSLFVALIINPALAAFFMPVKKTARTKKRDSKKIEIENSKFLKLYKKFLEDILDHRIKTLFGSFLLLIMLFFVWLLVVGLEKPVEFFPKSSPPSLYINLKIPEGVDISYPDKILKKIEMALNNKNTLDTDKTSYSYKKYDYTNRNGEKYTSPSDIENIEHIYTTASIEKSYGSMFGTEPNHIGIQFIDFLKRKKDSKLDVETIRKRLKNIAGATVTIHEEAGGPPTGAPINIEISGDDSQILSIIAKNIKNIIAKLPFIEDIRDDFVDSIPSIKIKVDRQKAAAIGLNTGLVGTALRIAYNGMDISTYREKGDDFDIVVRLNKKDREKTDILYNILLPTSSGKLVPLTSIAEIKYQGSFGDISRINHKRVVTVKANVDETKIPGATLRVQAEKLLKNFTLPEGYKIKFTGENEFQEESSEFLSKAFMIAIFLIFLILVTLFNSISQPFIIMTSVILSFGGVFLGLATIKSPFGIIMTGVGVISLAGVVVNNAIVLIDYINKLKQDGLATKEAIISGGITRFRPVMLTAITTILGLIPMLTGISFDFHTFTLSLISESSQYWRSMAVVVIYGLIIATFLTLIIVPVMCSLIDDLNNKRKRVFSQKL